MGSADAALLSSLLLLPDGMVIKAVYPTKTHLTVQVACTLKSASCPLCRQSSQRIHGSYERTVADVPCGGRKVTLALTVRTCVCGTSQCPRQIFTERIAEFVPSYARMSNRLSEAVQTLGFATCGEVGERVAPKLGMRASGPTLLRRMRTCSCPPPSSVRILGSDDWSWKKGMTFGTLLVDLELRKPIELLPDRSAETAQAWLRSHPEVEERASDAIPAKAQGIKDTSVQQKAETHSEPEPEKPYRTIPPSPYQRPAGMSYPEFQKQVRRDQRVARYEDVRTLFEQGLSQRAIARKLKLSRATVGKFVQAEAYPEMHHSERGASLLGPYKRSILQRWQHGCRNSVQLYDEITALGFSGSAPLLRKFLAQLRKKHQEAGSASALTFDPSTQANAIPASLPPKPRIACRISATRASWLCVSQAGKLDEKQKQQVGQIRAAHPDLERADQLSQEFVMMLASRRGADRDTWLTQAEHSNLPEFKKMANGIRQDDAAVKAACSSEWSNGQVEAQVNCLKLQKRIVFGRANFDLLRLRVLHRA
jgi:transposase